MRQIAPLLLLSFLLVVAPGHGAPPPPAPAKGQAELLEKENVVEAQKGKAKWQSAAVGLKFDDGDKVRTGEFSRATLRLSDLSTMRMDELTTFEIKPAASAGASKSIDLKQGGVYFFSRERAPEIKITTPAANGALRGTQLIVRVTPGLKTLMTVFEGQVDLQNALGRVLLNAGESGEAEIGKPPRKTAVIEAKNILQWALYYPGVLDPEELGVGAREGGAVGASLEAYRAGDLLGALEKYPKARSPASEAGRLYRAGVMLAVGRVDEAVAAMKGLAASTPGKRALEQMIAAVKFEDWTREGEPTTAAEWMAESYYEQSKSRLEPALAAARKAVELRPEFGYAWVRIAELEFSFGRTPRALEALEKGLALTPRNAQGHALRGFLLSAQNRITQARESFAIAIQLDGALGNAWLGRGLTYIRQGKDERGRLDLQTAATVEPTRSILHSYLGKAFSQIGDNSTARKDLKRAIELDPNDPTPFLYSAIQNKQENRYNEAIDDLEKSIQLNDNRRVYRSSLLLDQDRAVRGTNLAAIYLNDGMREQSVREAVRAVGSDYSSAAAHLFLANSYNALRDPTRVLLRYETGWFNELLVSNLLSPVGGGPLSQFVSEQEYSKLFQHDGFGIASTTDYFSTGELRETASQYGQFGNFSYALDAEYQYFDGLRPNNKISRLESYATFKFQLGPQDTLFLQTKYEDLRTGDILQDYDNGTVGRERTTYVPDANGELRKVVEKNVPRLTTNFHEKQEPALILAGLHHEWTPGMHTMLLLGRLANDQVLTSNDTNQGILGRDITRIVPLGLQYNGLAANARPIANSDLREFLKKRTGKGELNNVFSGPFDLDYRANLEIYSAELSHIITLGPSTTVLGSRFQSGQFETKVLLDDYANGTDPFGDLLFTNPPARQSAVVDFERINLYLYETLQLGPRLRVTGGLTYDHMRYPDNFRSAPVNEKQDAIDKLSPKVGFTLTPWKGATIRGAYAQALSGPSFDESIRLEPTQVDGFLQAYRTVVSESLLGSIGGSEYQFWGISVEQKLPTRTYLGIEYNILQQDIDRTVGVFDFLTTNDGRIPPGILPSSLGEKDSYREDIITATVNQLVGRDFAFGTRYRYTFSKLNQQLDGISDALARANDGNAQVLAANAAHLQSAGLHEVSIFGLYNHPSGLFARAEANWYRQENNDFVKSAIIPATGTPPGQRPRFRTNNIGLKGDDFWQLNLFAGYRFYKNQCEVSLGLLNIGGTDYHLNPLNPYLELPRDQTLLVRVKFNF